MSRELETGSAHRVLTPSLAKAGHRLAANIDMDKRFMRYPIADVGPGIWVWQEDYAGWTPGNDWFNPLNSSCVEIF